MNEIIDKIFKSLELEQTLWMELEKKKDYEYSINRIQEINERIREELKENLGKEGIQLLQEQEDLYYYLLDCSQRFFFEKGFLFGAKLQKDISDQKI